MSDQGAGVTVQHGQYSWKLEDAAYEGNEAAVKLLLDQGADSNAQGGHYGNALQAAAAATYIGNQAWVKLLLDRGADVNAQGGPYGNAFQAAACRGNKATVRHLLDRGADVNAQGGQYGNALQAAAYGGNEAAVKLLLGRGADVNAQGGHYGNALQAAAYVGNKATVRHLLDRGADVNAQGGEFGSAIPAAVSEDNGETTDMLLSYGAKEPTGRKAVDGSCVWHAAILTKIPNILQLLFSKFGTVSEINSRNNDGRTPLHLAVDKEDIEKTQWLLAHGSTTYQKHVYDMTPFQIAFEKKNRQLVQLFHSHELDKGFTGEALDWRRALSCKPNDVVLLMNTGTGTPEVQDVSSVERLIPRPSHLHSLTGCVEMVKSLLTENDGKKRLFIFSDTSLVGDFTTGLQCVWWRRENEGKSLHQPEWVSQPNIPTAVTLAMSSPDQCVLLCSLVLRSLTLQYNLPDESRSSESKLQKSEKKHGIRWTMVRPNQKSRTLVSMTFLSTSNHATMLTSFTELLVPLVSDIRAEWETSFRNAERHLTDMRTRSLRSLGTNSDIIKILMDDALLLQNIDSELKDQALSLRDAYKKARNQVLYEKTNEETDLDFREFKEAIELLESDGRKNLEALRVTSQELIQLEFNLTSIAEAQKSASTNASMKRLSWITFIFLPLMFIASLFGMNVDLLQNNPPWWLYLPFSIGTMVLTLTIWLLFKSNRDLEDNIEGKLKRMFRKRREHDVERGTIQDPQGKKNR